MYAEFRTNSDIKIERNYNKNKCIFEEYEDGNGNNDGNKGRAIYVKINESSEDKDLESILLKNIQFDTVGQTNNDNVT